MANTVVKTILDVIRVWAENLARHWGIPPVFVSILAWIAAFVFVIVLVLLMVLLAVYLERKVSGYIQSRLGPMRVGPIGLFQTPMDALKILTKEDIVPRDADKIMHTIGPVFFFVVAVAGYVVIPWDRGAIAARVVDLNIGVLLVMALSSLGLLGIMVGGWGSNNKWSLLGAMRAVAQMISYEVALLLAIVCVVMQAGSLSLAAITADQGGSLLQWNILRWWMWPALLLYVIASAAESKRIPFDIPEAESELVSGYHTEYSGMKFGFFFLGEYAHLFVIALIGTILFLGGWQSPLPGSIADFVPGFIWLMAKALAIIIITMWVRWTLPRLRVDQLMQFAWKGLVPLGFVAILVTGLAVALGLGGGGI